MRIPTVYRWQPMALPTSNRAAPFNVTRLSHVTLNVSDLDRSCAFYQDVIGLVVTQREDGVLYLRGTEETCHHSLVLRQTAASPTCERVGFRVLDEADLDRAQAFFAASGRLADFSDAAYQGRTLRLADAGDVPLELCAHMPTQPRRIVSFDRHRGAAATRIDHVQVHVSNVLAAAVFYAELGFRISEFASEDGTEQTPFRSIFMARKGNANDIVLLSNTGPRLHHLAYVVHDATATLVRVCDLLASQGQKTKVEWGPARHGLGYEQFLYLHDPDGHRVELLSPPYQFIDLDDEPCGWSTASEDVRNLWGPDPPKSWLTEATEFFGIEPRPLVAPSSEAVVARG